MSEHLEVLGREFDQARARWNVMPPGVGRDDLCDQLNRQAAAIRAIPADDLAGLAVKARAAAWACSVDLAHRDDVGAEAVAGLVDNIARMAGAA